MAPDTTHHQLTALQEWPQAALRLGAVLDFASCLGHTYPCVNFGRPSVLNTAQDLNRRTTWWHSSDEAEVWLEPRSGGITVGVSLQPLDRPSALIFWSISDPLQGGKSISGVMVGRGHRDRTVGKARRVGEAGRYIQGLCVLVTGELTSVPNRNLLSLLAKGFSEAATDLDRDAWVSWLWDQVCQGYLRSTYVRKLCSKVLARHSDEPALATSVNDSLEVVELLESVDAFERDADYVLPSGLHAGVHLNLGVACGYTEVVRRLAEHVKLLLDDCHYDVIASTGWHVAVIAREVIRLRPITAVGVVRHCGYQGVPPLPLSPAPRGARVIVLTDIIVSGLVVHQMSQMIEAGGAHVVAVVTIVDGTPHERRSENTDFMAVCKYDVGVVEQRDCPRCDRLQQRQFNPLPCCMTWKKEEPRSPGQFLMEDPKAAQFWKEVDLAHAYEHHRIEGTVHYVSFIDTERLLDHNTTGPSILKRLVEQIPRLIGTPDIFLIPARSRARRLADRLLGAMAGSGRLWLPETVAAKQVDGRFQLTAVESGSLKHANVLIVDTGVSSGATLEDLCHLARRADAASVAAIVLISRMSETQETATIMRLGGHFWSLYQLPIRPLSIPDSLRALCPICSRRAEVARAACESELTPIVELSNEIRWRRRRRTSTCVSTVTKTEDTQILLVAEAEVPFLEHCRRSTASGVTLHSLHAARNNGMAPIALPEICDDRIPTANRSAMLEYLGSSVWKWSSEALLRDAKRLLDERDLDEVWVTCATLRNQGSPEYWIEALERLLRSSEAALQNQSKAVWNRLAFEVYSRLKNAPSSLPEVSRRFRAMRRTCEQTPAEEGLTSILEVIEKAGDPSRL